MDPNEDLSNAFKEITRYFSSLAFIPHAPHVPKLGVDDDHLQLCSKRLKKLKPEVEILLKDLALKTQ